MNIYDFIVGRVPKAEIFRIFENENISRRTIYRTIAECEQGIPCLNLPKSGRPRVFTAQREERLAFVCLPDRTILNEHSSAFCILRLSCHENFYGNLDEVLDPKLTLSDYQITEIYVVLKGTVSLNQAFSTSDIMALRKEEERKQMHTKTGGGVFNLIFRRGEIVHSKNVVIKRCTVENKKKVISSWPAFGRSGNSTRVGKACALSHQTITLSLCLNHRTACFNEEYSTAYSASGGGHILACLG
ncbi:hypothetical protein NQ318_016598 [Aromia moschata]|uniref:Uncharacterized protein n=1 Tax=Aromia moschata TaxID=1265417 RepID=A0AAV8XZ77_9CUCU|nr:hypothetical protein NQ318_016598 [Aromia moschata]